LKLFHQIMAITQKFARNRDPLVEESNWVALMIGTHLPLWPVYIWWAAGRQAWPTSLWTISMTPVFLVIPILSRRNGQFGRVAMVIAGICNTLLTRWVLGPDCGTELFYIPCAVISAMFFRRSERWLMLGLSSLPLLVWYGSRKLGGAGLHHYDPASAHSIVILNVISVSVLVSALGWFQGRVYQRMERSPD
jgi:hypothetical protein